MRSSPRSFDAERFTKRAAIFAVLAPGSLAVAEAGSPRLDALVACVSAGAASELAALVRVGARDWVRLGAAATAVSLVLLQPTDRRCLAAATAAIAPTAAGGWDARVRPATASLLAGAAVAIPLRQLIVLRSSPHGSAWLQWTLATVWLNDAAAYLVGPRLPWAPLPTWINPSKSWSGMTPGWALAATSGAVYSRKLKVSRRCGGLLGLATGMAASAGDLLESALKRRRGQRNSGRALPGYGGVLDRVDSLLVAAPVVAAIAPRVQRAGWSSRRDH